MTDSQQEAQQEVPQIPLYVYAIAMMPDGQVKLVTELPFDAERKAVSSDVVMTAQFIADSIRRSADG